MKSARLFGIDEDGDGSTPRQSLVVQTEAAGDSTSAHARPGPSVSTSCLVILTTVGIGWSLHLLKELMIPLAIAALLAIVAGPAVDAITQKRLIGRTLRTFFCHCHLVAVRRCQRWLKSKGIVVGDDVDDGIEETGFALDADIPRSEGLSDEDMMRVATEESAAGVWQAEGVRNGAHEQSLTAAALRVRRTARSISVLRGAATAASSSARGTAKTSRLRSPTAVSSPTEIANGMRAQIKDVCAATKKVVLEALCIGRCPFSIALLIVLAAIVLAAAAVGSLIGLAAQQLITTDAREYARGIDGIFHSVAVLAGDVGVNITGAGLQAYAWESIQIETLVLGEVGAFVEIMGELSLVLIFLIFLLPARHSDALEHIVAAALPDDSNLVDQVTSHLAHTQQEIALYFRVKFILASASGFATAMIALCFGMQSLWIVVGIAVTVTDFIPLVGSAVGVLLPTLLLALNADIGLIHALIALPVFGLKQFVKDSLVEPMVVGNRLLLRDVAIVISLSFWTSVWGLPGAVLSVPILIVMRGLLGQLRKTSVGAAVLSGMLNAQAAEKDGRQREA